LQYSSHIFFPLKKASKRAASNSNTIPDVAFVLTSKEERLWRLEHPLIVTAAGELPVRKQ
jgi:hypothetical protein